MLRCYSVIEHVASCFLENNIYYYIHPCILQISFIQEWKEMTEYFHKNIKIYTAIIIMKNIVAYYQFQK